MKSDQEVFRLNKAQVVRGGKIILDIDSFAVNEGETIVILGPNGAGKSTLIKTITRQIHPLHHDDNPVMFLGKHLPEVADMRSVIGFVSSDMQDRITVHLPVLQIVLGALYGGLRVPPNKTATEKDIKQVKAVLSELGISYLEDSDMTILSTGQKRLVLIARALVHDPEILVFDEPCSGLDPKATWQLRETMNKLGNSGRTILLVTHRVDDIMPTFKRVVLMKDAKIIKDGSKSEVLNTKNLQELFNFPGSLDYKDGVYHLWEKHSTQ